MSPEGFDYEVVFSRRSGELLSVLSGVAEARFPGLLGTCPHVELGPSGLLLTQDPAETKPVWLGRGSAPKLLGEVPVPPRGLEIRVPAARLRAALESGDRLRVLLEPAGQWSFAAWRSGALLLAAGGSMGLFPLRLGHGKQGVVRSIEELSDPRLAGLRVLKASSAQRIFTLARLDPAAPAVEEAALELAELVSDPGRIQQLALGS
jgi:hypothetical protein